MGPQQVLFMDEISTGAPPCSVLDRQPSLSPPALSLHINLNPLSGSHHAVTASNITLPAATRPLHCRTAGPMNCRAPMIRALGTRAASAWLLPGLAQQALLAAQAWTAAPPSRSSSACATSPTCAAARCSWPCCSLRLRSMTCSTMSCSCLKVLPTAAFSTQATLQ